MKVLYTAESKVNAKLYKRETYFERFNIAGFLVTGQIVGDDSWHLVLLLVGPEGSQEGVVLLLAGDKSGKV